MTLTNKIKAQIEDAEGAYQAGFFGADYPQALRALLVAVEVMELARGYGRFDRDTPLEEIKYVRDTLRTALEKIERELAALKAAGVEIEEITQ